ncbi:MAG: helix-turn-helix domain-containing protein [Gemmataceae bacterium]
MQFLTLVEYLSRLEEKVDSLLKTVQTQTQKKWYTTSEFAELVGLSEFTIRKHCSEGRLRGKKRRSGRGAYLTWVLSHEELERYQREGLLPKH